MTSFEEPPGRDKRLFTPGPLTTSPTVKQAMLRDLGSRDTEFIATVRDIRRRLLAVGEASEDEYTCILMQGSGTCGLESVVASTRSSTPAEAIALFTAPTRLPTPPPVPAGTVTRTGSASSTLTSMWASAVVVPPLIGSATPLVLAPKKKRSETSEKRLA